MECIPASSASFAWATSAAGPCSSLDGNAPISAMTTSRVSFVAFPEFGPQTFRESDVQPTQSASIRCGRRLLESHTVTRYIEVPPKAPALGIERAVC